MRVPVPQTAPTAGALHTVTRYTGTTAMLAALLHWMQHWAVVAKHQLAVLSLDAAVRVPLHLLAALLKMTCPTRACMPCCTVQPSCWQTLWKGLQL